MKIQMPQGIHMRHLVAAHLAGFQTGLGSLDARCPFSAGYRPANPAVAFHVTDNGGIGRHAAVLRIGYNNDPDVVGVKLIAPTLVRSVLRFQQASQVGLYGSLLAGIRADLAAQHSDRILLLGARSVIPTLNRRCAELRRLPRYRVKPRCRGQLLQLRFQFTPRRRRGQQRPNNREPQVRPTLVRSGFFIVHRFRSFRSGSKSIFCPPTAKPIRGPPPDATGILCGPIATPQVSCRIDVFVKGRIKRSKSIILSSAPAFRNDSSNENGSVCSSNGRANCPLAHLQNELCGNSSSHHCRHRSNVRRLTPTMPRSCATLAAVAPCRSAVIRTTTAATYTRRDRNRNDAGVVRFRQPSSAQQKLRRLEYSSCSSSGAPRGF